MRTFRAQCPLAEGKEGPPAYLHEFQELPVDNLWNRTFRFLADDDGVTATEYAIMLGLIVVAAVGAIGSVGRKVDGVFTTLDQGISGGAGS